MYSVDNRFRNDKYYVAFLLCIKEKIEIKRSIQTYMRQNRRDPTLKTKENFSSIPRESLLKTNKTYSVYKTIRGTSMYYQAVKKDCMAFLRQKGAPTLFHTITSAEFNWDELFHQVLEFSLDRTLSPDEVEKMNITRTERNKILTDNVAITTVPFENRLQKIISYLKNEGLSGQNSLENGHLLIISIG